MPFPLSDPNGTRTHDLCRDRATSYSSRLWGRIKHISLARTHMPDASADCSFLPHLCQCRNAAQNVIRCYFSLLSSSFHSWVMSTATLLSKPLPNIYRLWLLIRLLFSSLLFMFPLLFTKCAGSFLSSQWLTIHHTPGRIRTHTAQILSLLSPAVGLLEQNHHRGSRTPSFWFVAKCFIH